MLVGTSGISESLNDDLLENWPRAVREDQQTRTRTIRQDDNYYRTTVKELTSYSALLSIDRCHVGNLGPVRQSRAQISGPLSPGKRAQAADALAWQAWPIVPVWRLHL